MVEWSITAVLKTAVLRGTGGSNPSLSAERFQKGFTKEVNLAFKIQIIVVKSRFYNDFSLYIALSFDGITLCFDSQHSVIFCYAWCYTKKTTSKNVAVTGLWLPYWLAQFFLFQFFMLNFVTVMLHKNDTLWERILRCPTTYAQTMRTKKVSCNVAYLPLWRNGKSRFHQNLCGQVCNVLELVDNFGFLI